jgi:hypothetical protein
MVGCVQWHHAGFREGQHGIDKYLPLVTGYSRQTAACRIEDIIENRECRGGEYAGWYVVAEFPELRAQQLKLVA